MSFFYYDIAFLIIFSIAVGLFLFKNRKKLQIESKVFLLYRTKVGLRVIEKLSKIIPSNFLCSVSIACGYILMVAAILFLFQAVKLFAGMLAVPNIPPLIPLVPYVTSIFKKEGQK